MDENQERFELGASKLMSAHHCSAGAGATWLNRGFGLFKKNPGLWVLMLLMTIIINAMCKYIPVVGDVAAMLISPVLLGGVMMAAHRCYMEFDAEFDDLFSGFRYRLWPLVQVALLYIGSIAIAMLIAIVIGIAFLGIETVHSMGDMIVKASGAFDASGALVKSSELEALDPMLAMGWIVIGVIMLTAFLPVMMLYYFAPVLVMFHGVDAFTAMKLSFVACCRNAVPFLIYGLLVMLLMVLSVFTLFLGLLILVPVLWTSTYVAYRDIFLTEEQELAA